MLLGEIHRKENEYGRYKEVNEVSFNIRVCVLVGSYVDGSLVFFLFRIHSRHFLEKVAYDGSPESQVVK